MKKTIYNIVFYCVALCFFTYRNIEEQLVSPFYWVMSVLLVGMLIFNVRQIVTLRNEEKATS
ncbi:hypothetical protein A374_15207 [Fictibacillus macauensis ZFHKF-1]|uniref:Lipoprotein n=1 Tax=Fictibacillus macauensis ZFHKF-1 TaxID=1196324 RepID=I8UC62_9BACL|nr:hypothetical protein [Fictibacillus macauensis]EIT84485.1 hypothetical protein A374_15207 [Fictibacillus macauensis ZFHKF-1]